MNLGDETKEAKAEKFFITKTVLVSLSTCALIVSLAGFFLLAGCATSSLDSSGRALFPQFNHGYEETLETWTKKDQAYQSLAATFQITATLLSRDLTEQQIQLDADEYKWSADQIRDAQTKARYELQTETTFLVSLYTAKDEDNNLDKASSPWNIFLDVHGRRLTPKSIKRIYENRAVLLHKYPYLNVWSRNYYIKFAIPVDEVAQSGVEFIFAGPVGNARLKYSKGEL